MKLQINVKLKISKPSDEVYNAIIKPEMVTKYWASESSRILKVDKTIKWTFSHYDNAVVEITAEKLEVGKKILFSWNATEKSTKVDFTLTEKDNETLIEIKENGWDKTDDGIEKYAGNTGGWVSFLCYLKAYMEYGAELRIGSYRI